MPNLLPAKAVVQERLQEFHLVPNQNLGQHFLIDDELLRLIAYQADTQSTIIEIGPGIGQLTERLAQKSKSVVAIEIDRRFEPVLQALQKKHRNLQIIFGDALRVDLLQIVKAATKKHVTSQIVANLPYQITEPFLNRVSQLPLTNLVLLVGRNFARSALAVTPDDPFYSSLSLLTQSFFLVEHLADVPKNAFMPEPRTSSDVLKLTPRASLTDTPSRTHFVGQQLFTTQSKGALLKNVIKESLISFGKQYQQSDSNQAVITQNQARAVMRLLSIPEPILSKPFSQLNNTEIKILTQQLQLL